MDRGDRVHRLEFDDDEILDKQVDPISEIQLHAIVVNRQANLDLDRKPSFASSC